MKSEFGYQSYGYIDAWIVAIQTQRDGDRACLDVNRKPIIATLLEGH